MKKIMISMGLMIAFLVAGTTFAQAQHKKISDQGKGAIIGGAGGAVVGGLVSHSVGGAVIGGAIGAGGGYIIGNEHRRHEAKERRIAAARARAYARAHRKPVHYEHSYASTSRQ